MKYFNFCHLKMDNDFRYCIMKCEITNFVDFLSLVVQVVVLLSLLLLLLTFSSRLSLFLASSLLTAI